MVDNVAVLPPGWRALDNNGDLLTDGILAFFAAGTTTPIQVYADSALTVSLGTSVSCNSAGYPVTGANAKTLIYTGAAAYKIRLSSAIFGGTVFEHDNVSGALSTAGFLTSSSTPSKFVVAEPNDRAVGASDRGKLIDVDCSAGTKTMTIDDATVLGSGWWCGIRHNGSANQVKIVGDGADLFALNGVNVPAFALTGRGQVVYMVCDGTGFKIDGEVPPLIGGTIGIITIASRLSTPPVSPVAGARYIVGAAPAGAWSTFVQHDIAEASGQGTWFKYTPQAGWRAYVADEGKLYTYFGTYWGSDAARSSVDGLTIVNNDLAPTTSLDLACSGAFIGTNIGAVAVTINAATVGANGLDAGALANSTFYAVWLIYNPSTAVAAGLLSLSATAPAMPAGFTLKMRAGWVKTGGAATLNRTRQTGNRAAYVVVAASVTPNLPLMGSGVIGSISTPTWISLTVRGVHVPTTATAIALVANSNTTSFTVLVAPNGAYGAFNSATNPPPVVSVGATSFELMNLESDAIFWASNSTIGVVAAIGWVDSVNAT